MGHHQTIGLLTTACLTRVTVNCHKSALPVLAVCFLLVMASETPLLCSFSVLVCMVSFIFKNGRGEGAHGPLCIIVEVMHGIYYMPLGSFVCTVAHSQMIIQVLWLGLSESASTWEPESSLPQNLVAGFEAGSDTEAEALT